MCQDVPLGRTASDLAKFARRLQGQRPQPERVQGYLVRPGFEIRIGGGYVPRGFSKLPGICKGPYPLLGSAERLRIEWLEPREPTGMR